MEGIAISYGDNASLPWGNEIIRENAFGDIENSDIILNHQHNRELALCRNKGGGLTLKNNASELTFKAELPDTNHGKDCYTLVKRKVIRGASIEFRALEDSYESDGTRIIEKAELVGIALVDRAAYPQSTIQAREKVLKNINKKKFRFWN